MSGQSISELMAGMGARARAVAAELAFASQERKYAALISAAHAVWDNRQQILDANCEDLVYADEKGLSAAMIDRLTLDENRIRGIVDGLRAVAEQIRAYVPSRYTVLGTDGYGRSDTREKLRYFFEVNRQWITVAALKALADDGVIAYEEVAKAIAKYNLDVNKPAPWTV